MAQAADLVDLQWLHHVEALAGGLREAMDGRRSVASGGFHAAWRKIYSFGPLPVISTYNPIDRLYNPIYNQL